MQEGKKHPPNVDQLMETMANVEPAMPQNEAPRFGQPAQCLASSPEVGQEPHFHYQNNSNSAVQHQRVTVPHTQMLG